MAAETLVGPAAPWHDDTEELDIPELVAAACATLPDGLAVACDEVPDCQLSFADLLGRCRELARELIARAHADLRNEDPLFVAVCLHRTPALVVALLGVLEAGAAYVPLDPTHPEARRNFVLEDSGAQLLVADSQSRWRGSLPQSACIELQASGHMVATSAAVPSNSHSTTKVADCFEPPAIRGADRDLLAYLIYTSGSTGAPKGVLVPRRGVRNVLHAFNSMLRTPARHNNGVDRADDQMVHSRDDVLVSVTTYCFDISALEIFWPLCFGFRLFLASTATGRSGQRLTDLLKEQQPRFFQATPATFRALLEAGWQGNPHLAAICGGEAFPRSMAPALVRLCGGGVWNAYGPTETTIWSTAHPLLATEERHEESTSSVPIGRPIAGTVLLLGDAGDEARGELAINDEDDAGRRMGELLIGGIGVTRGYHKRKELTAERFITCPESVVFDSPPTAYRTGDLVRFLTAGKESTVEFVGRMDNQVKLRGFRIELGEVEAILEQHSSVQAAATVVREVQHEEKSGTTLVSYIVLRHGDSAATSPIRRELRAHLAAQLPAYMVPEHIVAVS